MVDYELTDLWVGFVICGFVIGFRYFIVDLGLSLGFVGFRFVGVLWVTILFVCVFYFYLGLGLLYCCWRFDLDI